MLEVTAPFFIGRGSWLLSEFPQLMLSEELCVAKNTEGQPEFATGKLPEIFHKDQILAKDTENVYNIEKFCVWMCVYVCAHTFFYMQTSNM